MAKQTNGSRKTKTKRKKKTPFGSDSTKKVPKKNINQLYFNTKGVVNLSKTVALFIFLILYIAPVVIVLRLIWDLIKYIAGKIGKRIKGWLPDWPPKA